MEIPKSIGTMRRRIAAKIRSLGEVGTFMAGSLVEKRWRCAKPDCICRRTGKLHTAHAVTSKVGGKTRNVYVPVGMVEEVRGWTREYKRVQKILKEVSAMAEQLVKMAVPVARAAGRRKKSLESTTGTSQG